MANLAYGSSGADVKALQQQLMAAGYDVGSSGADGIFGAKTQEAVKAYQAANGLAVDGIAGINTQTSLNNGGNQQQQQQVGASTGISIPDYQTYLNASGFDAYKNSLTDAIKAQTRQAVDAYEQQIKDTEAEKEDLARAAYVSKMQSQRNLDQQLSAAGYGGGMADSQRIAVENDYQKALADIQTQEQKDVDALRRAIIQAELQGDSDLNGYLADYQQQVSNSYRNYAAQAQQQAYNQVMGYLEMGIMPSASDLAAAGIDQATAAIIVGQNQQTGSGGGTSRSSGGGYNNQGVSESVIKAIQEGLGVTADGKWGPQTQAAYEAAGYTGGVKEAEQNYYDYVRAQKTGDYGYYYGG